MIRCANCEYNHVAQINGVINKNCIFVNTRDRVALVFTVDDKTGVLKYELVYGDIVLVKDK